MFRARTTLKATVEELRAIMVDVDVRKKWETILFDFTTFDKAEDGSGNLNIYYVYKSPFGVSDRDFLQV